MARGRVPAARPLLDKPKTQVFNVIGPRSAVDVEISYFPQQWIYYQVRWVKTPPTGISALIEGQVVLRKSGVGRRGDNLKMLRAQSNGIIYQPGNGGHPVHAYQLDDVEDIEFRGSIREGVF